MAMDWFPFASIVVALPVLAILLRLSGRTAILKDQLVPQLAPHEQTFSLARSQMAWWFIIILGCVVYVFLQRIYHSASGGTALLDNLVTPQIVMLMGLSALTAGGAGAVDTAKNTPEDDLNAALRQLGLRSYGDVVALRGALQTWKETKPDDVALTRAESSAVAEASAAAAAAANPAWSDAAKAQDLADRTSAAKNDKRNGTIADKQRLLATYAQKTAAFTTCGWFRDMVTDIDGTSLHRLQAVVWTVLISAAFVYVTVQTTQMPSLDDNILALMGISSAGYVGFKYNESQY